MAPIDKVKLMDSGTALFRAESLPDAVARVKGVLGAGGGTVETPAEGRLVLDGSDRIYYKVITAQVEPTSVPGRFAASFKEANAPTVLGKVLLRFLPARSCQRRMERILATLAD